MSKKYNFPEGEFVTCPTCQFGFSTGYYPGHKVGEVSFCSEKCKNVYVKNLGVKL